MAATINNNILCYKGSDYLNQRLVLSILSGKPVRINDIRYMAAEPGLAEFEISLVRLLDKITNGTVIELNETGTSLYFQPGLLHGGLVEHDCSTEFGLGYYLEPLLMLGLFCKEPLTAVLRGVTTCNTFPSPDVIKSSMLGVLKKFTLDDEGFDIQIKKRGLLPLGGGEILFKCPILKQLRPIELEHLGKAKRIRGTAYALRVSPAIANRMIETAKGVLLKFLPDVYISTDQRRGNEAGRSPGFGIHLSLETTTGVVYSSELVSDEKCAYQVPEEVGRHAAHRLLDECYSGGMCDAVSQPIAMLCMALGQQDVSRFVTGELTEYAVDFLRHLKEFFGITFNVEHSPEPNLEESSVLHCSQRVLLTCVGVGYKNLSKRTI